MKNDLRQSVDRAFAGATWDDAHARRVIRTIEERNQPVMKRKLTVAMVCVMVLVLVSVCALAAVFVQRSERSNAIMMARKALTRQYHFTSGMLALFNAEAEENIGGDYTVTFTSNDGVPSTLLGVYTVHVSGGTTTAKWSYDGCTADIDHWDANVMAAYLAEDTDGWMMGEAEAPYHEYAMQVFSLSASNVTPTPIVSAASRALEEDEVYYDGEVARIVKAGSQDITQERAEELAIAALMEEFNLTQDAFEDEYTELTDAYIYQRTNGQRIWSLTWYIPASVSGNEFCVAVTLDALTEEILSCDAVTGGIG